MKTEFFKKSAAALLISAIMVTALSLTGIKASAADIKTDSAKALQDAITEAGTAAANLKLTADITADSSIVIGKGQDITIDLAGFAIGRSLDSAEASGSVIIVEGGSLTVKDSSQNHTGCITGGASTGYGGGIYCLKKEKLPSSLTLSGITLRDNKAGSGGAVYAESGCKVTAESCCFEGNSAERGGAVTGIGTVTLNNCTVSDNKAEYYGGGIYVDTKDAVSVTGTTVFSGNSSGTDGGAVYANGGSLSVTGASFKENQAVVSGGAVVIGEKATAEISRATFDMNLCTDNGGAVFSMGSLALTKSSLTDNSAKYGGGVFNSGKLTLTGTSITKNNCTENGGGIYQSAGTITLGGGITKVKGNIKNDNNDDENDMAFAAFSKMTVTGRFERGTRIGLYLSDMQGEITTGYGKNNTVAANNYFFTNNDEFRISPDKKKTEAYFEKDPNTVRNTSKSIVEVYSNGQRLSKSEYGSPASAWGAAYGAAGSDNDTILTLGGDWVIGNMNEVSGNKKITIDLNGHFIKRDLDHEMKDDGGLFKVKGSSSLIIRDSSPESSGYDGIKGGVLTGGASSDTGGCFEITKKGHVYIEGGTVYDCITDEDGGAVRIEEGSLTMSGGRIYNCKTIDSADTCQGGAIYLNEGVVRLSDCTIDDCYSEDSGGAIYSDEGTIDLRNVTFSGNTCRDYGGAICLWNDTSLNARGCVFSGNQTEEDGGALYIDDAPDDYGAILFDNCIFRRNKAGEDGGAIYVCDDCLALSNTEITNNYAKERGGAVFVDCRYRITLRGLVTIKDNTCDDPSMANLTLEYGTFTDAKVMSSGLYKGSCIRIGTTHGSGETKLTHNSFNKYQVKYFEPDEGRIEFDRLGGRYISLVTSASIFGNGSVTVIIFFGGFWIVLAVIVVAAKKEKDKKASALKADNEGGKENDQK